MICRKIVRTLVVTTALLSFMSKLAHSQDAVPMEILQRTFEIQVGDYRGTAFTIDHKGEIYLITARHMADQLANTKSPIRILHADKWEDFHPTQTIFPSSSDVDIAVFDTGQKAEHPFLIGIPGETGSTSGGPTFGQQVWFLGYPFVEGLHTRTKSGEIPFIKRGTMSAIDSTNENAIIYYIDGFNNEGFSGGPILYWDFTNHVYEILGVVKGYKNEAAKVRINGQEVDTPLLVNSGILVGYSIEHAIQAIEQSQQHK